MIEVVHRGSDACPDADQLAVYIEGGLTPDERAAIERHMADCEDCREVLIETVALGDLALTGTSPERNRGTVLRFTGRWRFAAIGAGGLALAASLVLVFLVQPDLLRLGEPPPYQELAAAVRTNRPVEGRLTGGFEYAPLRPATRSAIDNSRPNDSLLAAAARLKRTHEASPNIQTQQALAAAQLLLGDVDAAVDNLEGAAAADPENAGIQNDLAVAYLARGTSADVPEDYQRALAAAERARRLDPRLREALFNRALALESLGLREQALEAWAEVVRVEGSGGWADEARDHMAGLRAISFGR